MEFRRVLFRSGQHLFGHVLPIVQKRRADPIERDDLIGFLLNLNKNGVTFTDVDITNFVRMLLLAATETTTRTFGNMLAQLFDHPDVLERRSEEHTSELQSLMRISYAVFCLKNKR